MCFFPNWKTQSVCGQNGSSEHNAASTAAAKEVLLALYGKYTHVLLILETALERMEMSLFFLCTFSEVRGKKCGHFPFGERIQFGVYSPTPSIFYKSCLVFGLSISYAQYILASYLTQAHTQGLDAYRTPFLLSPCSIFSCVNLNILNRVYSNGKSWLSLTAYLKNGQL